MAGYQNGYWLPDFTIRRAGTLWHPPVYLLFGGQIKGNDVIRDIRRVAGAAD